MNASVEKESQSNHEHALTMLAWGRIWSPVVSEHLQREAWQALNLPGTFDQMSVKLTSTFHVGQPSPQVSLLLHAALNQDGSVVREAWMRVMEHLQLAWNDVLLPPDHLGLVCELFAIALERQEAVLVDELVERFLSPWCELANSMVQEDAELLSMVRCFKEDIEERTVADRD